MALDQIRKTLDGIKHANWLTGGYGPQYAAQLDRKLANKNKKAIDGALSLGVYLNHSQSNKEKRVATRAILLAQFAVRNRPVQSKGQILSRLKNLSRDQLAKVFRDSMGSVWDNGKRLAWAPQNFTDPNGTVGQALQQRTDWRNKAIPSFRFMVHSLLHGDDRLASSAAILRRPAATLSGWSAISCSVISDQKPWPYGCMGLILRVSERNILTTSPTDQQFKNHIGTKFGRTDAEKTGGLANQFKLAQHISEKNVEYGGLKTPTEVLAQQGVSPDGTYVTQHSEVVVIGQPGVDFGAGATQPITVPALFIRVDHRGETYQPKKVLKEMGARAIKMMEYYAQLHGIPLLRIPDASGKRGAG